METFVLRWTKDNLPFWQGVDDGEKIEINAIADVINEHVALKRENEALKLFVHMVHKDECASLLAGNKECDCGYDTLPDFELAQAAEELREHYLENEEEK